MPFFHAGTGYSGVTMNDLLKIEDTPDLLALRCPRTGIPIWATMRIAFLRHIMGDLLFDGGLSDPLPQPRSWRAVVALGRALWVNQRTLIARNPRSELLLQTNGIGDELRDRRWFNRYADPFGDLSSGRAVVLTDLFEWHLRSPRHNDRLVYHAPLQVRAALTARMSRHAGSTALVEAAMSLIVERARSLIGWDIGAARHAAFTAWAARKVAALPLRYNAYRRLLRRVKPRLVLGLAGCYGADAPLIAAAKDLGIVTGEFQHGSISSGHDAYNYAPAIFTSDDYRRTLPQYLLTYGDWWGTQIAAPVECIAIGNPTRAHKLARMSPITAERRTVLILGDGITFNTHLDLARRIAGVVAPMGLDVALRPHPLERTQIVRQFGERIEDVRIDLSPDIFTSLRAAHTVVGEVSTGMFDAIGLVERIIILNTPRARFVYPDLPFAIANSIEQVIEWISGGAQPAPTIASEDLWARDWKENYRWFLSAKVGIDG